MINFGEHEGNNMSDIQFNCPECGHSLAVDSAGAGMVVPCPECHKQIVIPAAPQPLPPSGSYMAPPASGKPNKKSRLPVIGLALGVLGLWFMGLWAAIPAVICAHVAKKRALKSPTGQDKGIASAGLVVGYLAIAISLFMGSCGLFGGKMGGDDRPAAPPPIVTKEAIQQKLQTVLNIKDAEFNGPQMVFSLIHPIGTASRVVVHDVSLQWKTDRPTADENDIMSWTCRLTVYWSSIRVDEGFTKLLLTFDNEVGNFTKKEILATNGMTTEEVNAAAWDVGFQIGLMLAE